MLTYSLQEELQRKGGGRSSGGSRKSRKKRVQKDDGTYGMLIEFVMINYLKACGGLGRVARSEGKPTDLVRLELSTMLLVYIYPTTELPVQSG